MHIHTPETRPGTYAAVRDITLAPAITNFRLESEPGSLTNEAQGPGSLFHAASQLKRR
jgi:hypothetical protein